MSVEEFDTEKLMQNAARQRDQRKFNDMLISDVDAIETESWEIVEFIEDRFYVNLLVRLADRSPWINVLAGACRLSGY